MRFDKLLKTLLSEKTRAAKLGIYEDDSVVEGLMRYANDPNVFIHMSELNKLGNNPKSSETYHTPQGIYLYPLQYYWRKYLKKTAIDNIPPDELKVDLNRPMDDINVDGKDVHITGSMFKKFMDTLPFKAEAKYIVVGKLKPGVVLTRFVSGWTSAVYKSAMDKLRNYFEKLYDDNQDELSGEMSKEEAMSEYDGIVKDAESQYPASGRGLSMGLWNVTRCLTSETPSAMTKYMSAKTEITQWTYLLYNVLGFKGFYDSTGIGIIHENEKVQAVVFNGADIEHIDTILNKEKYSFSFEMEKKRAANFNNLMREIDNRSVFVDDISPKKLFDLAKSYPSFASKHPEILRLLDEPKMIKLIEIQPSLIIPAMKIFKNQNLILKLVEGGRNKSVLKYVDLPYDTQLKILNTRDGYELLQYFKTVDDRILMKLIEAGEVYIIRAAFPTIYINANKNGVKIPDEITEKLLDRVPSSIQYISRNDYTGIVGIVPEKFVMQVLSKGNGSFFDYIPKQSFTKKSLLYVLKHAPSNLLSSPDSSIKFLNSVKPHRDALKELIYKFFKTEKYSSSKVTQEMLESMPKEQRDLIEEVLNVD